MHIYLSCSLEQASFMIAALAEGRSFCTEDAFREKVESLQIVLQLFGQFGPDHQFWSRSNLGKVLQTFQILEHAPDETMYCYDIV